MACLATCSVYSASAISATLASAGSFVDSATRRASTAFSFSCTDIALLTKACVFWLTSAMSSSFMSVEALLSLSALATVSVLAEARIAAMIWIAPSVTAPMIMTQPFASNAANIVHLLWNYRLIVLSFVPAYVIHGPAKDRQ